VPEKFETCGWALVASGILLEAIAFATALMVATDQNLRLYIIDDPLKNWASIFVVIAGGLMIFLGSKAIAYAEDR